MWDHSASYMSVRYALLMLGRISSHCLRTPFRTVSEGEFCERRPTSVLRGLHDPGPMPSSVSYVPDRGSWFALHKIPIYLREVLWPP
jgi:hypothetical protein